MTFIVSDKIFVKTGFKIYKNGLQEALNPS